MHLLRFLRQLDGSREIVPLHGEALGVIVLAAGLGEQLRPYTLLPGQAWFSHPSPPRRGRGLLNCACSVHAPPMALPRSGGRILSGRIRTCEPLIWNVLCSVCVLKSKIQATVR